MTTLTEQLPIIRDALVEQGEQSQFYNDCMYRGPDGLKCAVGFLITDKYYDSSFEQEATDAPQVVMALEDSLDIRLDESDIELLNSMQDIHDSWVNEEVSGTWTDWVTSQFDTLIGEQDAN